MNLDLQVNQLMVCVGPDASNVAKKEDWRCVSQGALHALYILKADAQAAQGPASQLPIEGRPHTFQVWQGGGGRGALRARLRCQPATPEASGGSQRTRCVRTYLPSHRL